MQHQTATAIEFGDYTASRNRAIADTVRQLNERAAATGHAGRVNHQDIEMLMTYSGWRCTCCQAKFTPLAPLSAEHVYPLGTTRQGFNRPSNIRVVCADCGREAAPKPEQRAIAKRQRPTTSSNMRAVA